MQRLPNEHLRAPHEGFGKQRFVRGTMSATFRVVFIKSYAFCSFTFTYLRSRKPVISIPEVCRISGSSYRTIVHYAHVNEQRVFEKWKNFEYSPGRLGVAANRTAA